MAFKSPKAQLGHEVDVERQDFSNIHFTPKRLTNWATIYTNPAQPDLSRLIILAFYSAAHPKDVRKYVDYYSSLDPRVAILVFRSSARRRMISLECSVCMSGCVMYALKELPRDNTIAKVDTLLHVFGEDGLQETTLLDEISCADPAEGFMSFDIRVVVWDEQLTTLGRAARYFRHPGSNPLAWLSSLLSIFSILVSNLLLLCFCCGRNSMMRLSAERMRQRLIMGWPPSKKGPALEFHLDTVNSSFVSKADEEEVSMHTGRSSIGSSSQSLSESEASKLFSGEKSTHQDPWTTIANAIHRP